MQNMWDILAKTLEYRSKYIHILNPTVREDIVHHLTAVTNCQICVRLKKAAERTKSRLTPLACRRWQLAFVYSFFQH